MPTEIKRGNTKLALKSGFWYVLSTVITKGLAFITTPIFARMMNKTDYGEFSNFAYWQSLLVIVVSLEMYNTLSRAFYDYKDDYEQYASTVTIAGIITSAVFYVLFLLSSKWIYKLVAIPPQFIHLMFFTILCQGARQVFLTKERTLYKYKSVAFISMISLVIPTLLSIAIVYCVSESERLSARMYGFYIPYALIGLYCAFDLIRKGKCFKLDHLKYALVLAMPLLVHYLTTYILSSTNVIFAKSILGSEAAAILSIITSIMNILTILFQSVTGAMTTYMMDYLETRTYDKVRNCLTLLAVGSAVISCGLIIFGPEVVTIIGGSKYRSAVSLIPTSVLAIFFQILTSSLAIILTYDKNVVKTAVYTAAIAIVSIILKILLLKQCGYAILPVINAAAFVMTLIVNSILVCRAGYKKCIDFKKILGIVILMVMFTLIAPILYQYTAFRYIVISLLFVVFAVILIIKRNLWLPMIKKYMKKGNQSERS